MTTRQKLEGKRNFMHRIRIWYLKTVYSTSRDERPEFSAFSGSKLVFWSLSTEDTPSQCSGENFSWLLAKQNHITLSIWKMCDFWIGGRFWCLQPALNWAGNCDLGASAHFQKCAENSRNFEIPKISAYAIQMSLGWLRKLVGAPRTSFLKLAYFSACFSSQNTPGLKQNIWEKCTHSETPSQM